MLPPAAGDVQEPFQYSPLPSTSHIRILVLQPFKGFGDPIHADIEIADVTQAPKYTALSYSWGMNEDGDASLCRTITVQGARLAITRNLFEGLQRLLSSQQPMPLRLWVDAVCINQTDAREQSSQVAMMAKIYSNAYRTIIWLGEGHEENDLQAVQLFKRLQDIRLHVTEPHSDPVIHALVASGVGRCMASRESHVCSCGQPYIPPTLGRHWCGVNWDEKLFTTLSRNRTLLKLFASRVMALACFLNRRYWTRRWVLQEIRHSKALSIHWTRFEISPRVFQFIHVHLKSIFLLSREVMRRFKIDNFDMWPRRNMESVDPTHNDAMTALEYQFQHIRNLFSTPTKFDDSPEWNIE